MKISLTQKTYVVSYGDIFFGETTLQSLIESRADLAIAYDPKWLDLWSNRFDDVLSDAESFKLNQDNILQEIGRKPRSISDIQGQYMGLLKFNPTSWRVFIHHWQSLSEEIGRTIDMTSMLQKIIETKKLEIIAVKAKGVWGEVDTQTDLELYNKKVNE